MAPQRRGPLPGRRPALIAVLIVSATTAAADSEKSKPGTTAANKLEKSFLLEPRHIALTCPPPEFFYQHCHTAHDFVQYRNQHSQHQFEHENHFRPVAGPPQPRPRPRLPPQLPRPKPHLPPRKPSLVTFVSEDSRGFGRRDPWYPPGHRSRGHGPPARRPDWRGAAGRDSHTWRDKCYRLQRRDTRLENHILQVINSRELLDCEESCDRDRRCVSFNFRSRPDESVCELTDMDSYANIAQFREMAGWDFYERDASSYCSGWDNDYFDQHDFGYAYCSARVQDNSLLNVNAVRRDITARSLAECEQACRDERAFRCETFSFGVQRGGRTFSCLLTDLRVGELSSRDIEPAPNFEIYDFHGNGRECDRPNDQYDFRHGALETSSGRECARGPCRIDRSGGYWYCFTDEGIWDYCCDPDSDCKRDPRMDDMETCFVTQGRGLYRNAGLDTAWRPCRSRPGRFAYLTRNSTDHKVDDTPADRADSASGGAASNLLETIDLEKERSKSKK